MNTKLVMTLSAAFLALLGLGLTFLPQEISSYLSLGDGAAIHLVLQLLGALYLGFAMLNWMAKGSLLGGIYNRPIAVANFTHFFVGALALIKGNPGTALPTLVVVGLYSVFALVFGIILYRHPLKAEAGA
ncbi:hypothetical protein [Sabulibacter ruber]|uniref:hypothetical protein n=1 Tax=Sabulibacter ruber TaxID=2811901 RepID=UPI001A958786|nr:hypothetical protein [Sabulibacter ruber]